MQIERSDRQHLLVTVEETDDLIDRTSGSTLRVPIRGIEHPEVTETWDAEIVYVADRDLYVASWYYDGILRRRENRDGDPRTWYCSPGDEGYSETDLAPPDAEVLWKTKASRNGRGGARPHEGD